MMKIITVSVTETKNTKVTTNAGRNGCPRFELQVNDERSLSLNVTLFVDDTCSIEYVAACLVVLASDKVTALGRTGLGMQSSLAVLLGLTDISIILGNSVFDLGMSDRNAFVIDVATVLLNTEPKLVLSGSHLNSSEFI